MHLKSVRIRNYRNIVDSGDLTVDPAMTCLVGKNEAGKSAVLSAIHALNPVEGDFDLAYWRDYPQWYWKDHQRAFKKGEKVGGYGAEPMVVGVYEIDEATADALAANFGPGTYTSTTYTIKRWYPEGSDDAVYWLSVDPAAFVTWFAEQHGLDLELGSDPVYSLREHVEDGDLTNAREALEALLGTGSLISAVSRFIRSHHLPRSLYFSDYSQLDGEYPLNDVLDEVDSPSETASAALRTAADFLRLAAIDREGAEADGYVEATAELRAVSNDLTREMRKFWSQSNNVSLKVDIDKRERQVNSQRQVVDRYLRFEIDDAEHGFQTNLDLRSTGFRWFVSFMAAFFDHRDDDRLMLLFDEPGLTLHARAQTDLLDAIAERIADTRQTVYSTHSPFMIRPESLDQVRIVEDHGPDDGGAQVSDSITATDRDTLFPLQAALGYDNARNLFIGPHNVLVEGTSDFVYLNYFRNRLAGDEAPLRPSATILSTRGVTKMPAFLAVLGRPHLDVVAVIDGDAPDQHMQRAIDRGLVAADAVICIGTHALAKTKNGDIEDLFDVSNYLAIFNAAIGTSYRADDLPPGDRILKRLEALHGNFNHGEVAEYFLHHVTDLAPNEQTAKRFLSLLSAIDAALPE